MALERRQVVDYDYVIRNGSPEVKFKTYEITYRLYGFNDARGIFTGPRGSWEVGTFYARVDSFVAQEIVEHITKGEDEEAYARIHSILNAVYYQEGRLVFRLSDEGRKRAYMVAEAKVDTYDRDEWGPEDWDDFIATDPAYWIRYASGTMQEKPDDLALQDFLWEESRSREEVGYLSPYDYELVDYDGTAGHLPENIASMLEQEGFQVDDYATETISPMFPRPFNFMQG